MKKVLALVIIGTMVLAGSVFAFADTVCELDPEVYAEVMEIKEIFLAEKVADGTITQMEATAIKVNLDAQTGNDELRDLGFGVWLHESEYFETLADILPHKNMQNRENAGGRGFRMNFDKENLSEEQLAEMDARHSERLENNDFSRRGMGKRGFRD